MTDDRVIPVEHEIDPESFYQCSVHNHVAAGFVKFSGHMADIESLNPDCRWYRIGQVARYRPELKEPTGLGAVIRDANGYVWTRIYDEGRWVFQEPGVQSKTWSEHIRPITILSAGWSE